MNVEIGEEQMIQSIPSKLLSYYIHDMSAYLRWIPK